MKTNFFLDILTVHERKGKRKRERTQRFNYPQDIFGAIRFGYIQLVSLLFLSLSQSPCCCDDVGMDIRIHKPNGRSLRTHCWCTYSCKVWFFWGSFVVVGIGCYLSIYYYYFGVFQQIECKLSIKKKKNPNRMMDMYMDIYIYIW